VAVIPRVSAELPAKKKIKINVQKKPGIFFRAFFVVVIDVALIAGHGELIVSRAVEDVDGMRQ
jgi:hypothetical protein